MADDTALWPAMVALSECLCETLEAEGLLPGDCFCGVLPGDNVAWDYKEGMAWVRLQDAFPSAVFPTQSTALRNCDTPIAATLEVGVLHCHPGLGPNGTFPSREMQFEATRQQMAAMAAMRKAVQCCGIDTLILGLYTPLGPQGLYVGGSWTVYIGEEDGV